MAWTTPRTWVSGELVTASIMNTHVRDNLNALNAGSVLTTTSTGTVNDFNPGSISGPVTLLRCNNASLLTIQGLVAGVTGQIIILESIGAGNVSLAHQNTGSTAANRLINIVTSGVSLLAAGSGVAILQYDGTTARWRMVHHAQGAWLTYTPTYGGNGAMTFTSVTGTVAYYVEGRKIQLSFDITGTVGGTLNTGLTVTLPNSYTSLQAHFDVYNALGLNKANLCQLGAVGNIVSFFADNNASSNWPSGSQRFMATLLFSLT